MSYMSVDQMPVQYREPYILTGYRKPHSTWSNCLRSLIHASNETLNVWTHLLPVIYFLRRFIQFYSINHGDCYDYYYYPFMTNYIGVLIYHIASSIAHLFCSMSLRARHTCFYTDYSGICIYAVGAGVTYYHLYVIPVNQEIRLPIAHAVFAALSLLITVSVCLISCVSRHYWKSRGAVIRTVAFAINLIYNTCPGLWLFWQYKLHSASYLIRQWSWYMMAITAYVFKIPEKAAPGKFDIVGHSHQWFHLFLSLGTVEQLNSLEADYQVCKMTNLSNLPEPTIQSTVGLVALAITCTILIVSICSYKLARYEKLRLE